MDSVAGRQEWELQAEALRAERAEAVMLVVLVLVVVVVVVVVAVLRRTRSVPARRTQVRLKSIPRPPQPSTSRSRSPDELPTASMTSEPSTARLSWRLEDFRP